MRDEIATHELLLRVEQLIGSDLQEVERIFQAELQSWHPYVTDILTHITRFRGKRLRPILLLLSAQATGDLKAEHHVLAAVVEMIHMATLVHDDVLDDADIRRHVATVNTRWTNETSILFGDYLFTHAFHLASSLESTQACRLIGRATNLVCEGELAQIHERGNLELDEERYLRIIEGKTAELCSVSCRLGALYSQGDPELCEILAEYGRCLGIAFQMADDLLDILGSESEAGKSLGSDLLKQKLTLPLIRLLDQVDGAKAARIRELLARPDESTPAELRLLLGETDAVQYAHGRALEYAGKARDLLQQLPDSPSRQSLMEFAEFAVERSF